MSRCFFYFFITCFDRFSGLVEYLQNIPAHIDSSKLPDRVWFNSSGAGKWMLTSYDEFHKRQAKRICGDEATLSEIWHATEAPAAKNNRHIYHAIARIPANPHME